MAFGIRVARFIADFTSPVREQRAIQFERERSQALQLAQQIAQSFSRALPVPTRRGGQGDRLRQFVREMTPSDSRTLQSYAFQGVRPEEVGAERTRQFGAAIAGRPDVAAAIRAIARAGTPEQVVRELRPPYKPEIITGREQQLVALQRAEELLARGEVSEADVESVRRGTPTRNIVGLIAKRGMRDEGDQAIFDMYRTEFKRRQERAPLSAFDIPFAVVGEQAGRGAEALGAPSGVATGVNIGAQVLGSAILPAKGPAILRAGIVGAGGNAPRTRAATALADAAEAAGHVDDAAAIRRTVTEPPTTLPARIESPAAPAVRAVPEAAAETGGLPALAPPAREAPARMGGGAGGRQVQEPTGRLGEPDQFVRGQGGRLPGFEELPDYETVQGLIDDARAGIKADDVLNARDEVGELLNRSGLPPTTQAGQQLVRYTDEAGNARFRRPTAGEKAAMATAKLQAISTRRFQAPEEAAQRFGERFRQNLFTRIDDFLAPLRGRNRAQERLVRNAVVAADLYKGTEEAVAEARFMEWIARHQRTLGLDLGTGRATAVPVRQGAQPGQAAAQRLDDIVERAEDYVISAQQQGALDEMFAEGGILDEMLRLNQQAGIEIEETLGRQYHPHIVIEEATIEAVGGARPEGIGARPWFAKPREFETVREGLAAGKEYANPLDALRMRLVGGIDAMANRRLADQLKRIGYQPTEKVAQSLRDELADATAAYRAARATAAKTGSTADRWAAAAAEERLRVAKTAMAHEADVIRQRRPQLFGRVVPEDAFNEFAKYVQNVQPDALDEMFQVARGVMISLDYASPGVQNWFLFWRNNPAWLKAFALGASAMRRSPYEYVARNIDEITTLARAGFLTPPSEFLLARGGSISQKLARAPGSKQSQRGFEWNIFVGQVERGKALLSKVKNVDELIDMAAVVRKQSGSMLIPGMTRRQAWLLSKTWFAPRFYAAIHGALLDPLVTRGPAQREAVKGLAAAFGGAAAATVGLNMLINGELPNMDDPRKGGYWGVRVGKDRYVYLFGPYQPLINALGAVVNGDPKAIARYVEGKGSLPIRWLIRASEAMGAPISDLRGEPYQEPTRTFTGRPGFDVARDVLPLPIGPAQVAESIVEGDFSPLDLLEPVGGRVSRVGPYQRFREEFERRTGQRIDDIGFSAARTLVEGRDDLADLRGLLQRAQEESRRRGRPTALAQEVRTEEAAAEADRLFAPIIEQVRAGRPEFGQQFRERYAEWQTFVAGATRALYSGREFKDPDTPAEQALEAFYEIVPDTYLDSETGQTDWVAYDRARDEALADVDRLVPGFRAAYEAKLRLPEQFQDVERRYRQAKQLLDQSPPKYQGLSNDEHSQLQGFLARVRQFRADVERGAVPGYRSGVATDFDKALRDRAHAWAGEYPGWTADLLYKWSKVVSSERLRERYGNPDYQQFLLDHYDQLYLFYPHLYGQELRQQVGTVSPERATPALPQHLIR